MDFGRLATRQKMETYVKCKQAVRPSLSKINIGIYSTCLLKAFHCFWPLFLFLRFYHFRQTITQVIYKNWNLKNKDNIFMSYCICYFLEIDETLEQKIEKEEKQQNRLEGDHWRQSSYEHLWKSVIRIHIIHKEWTKHINGVY